MRLLICLTLLLSNLAFADAGKIIKVQGPKKSFLMRGKEKIQLKKGLSLLMGDKISTQDSIVLIQIDPKAQLGLAKKTEITISDFQITEGNGVKRAFSLIDLHKGVIRGSVPKDTKVEIEQKINTEGASLAVHEGEFEASLKKNGDVDINVVKGEVLVSSPFIQSFVPEVVKAKEGLSFERKKKSFAKRKFAPTFKNYPKFVE